MKINVDYTLCAAHGDCVVGAPEVFDLGDDDAAVVLLREQPDEGFRAAVERAAASCPVSAIRIDG